MEWQQLLTFGIVLAAGGYLARRAWLQFSGRQAGGCGACSGCSAAAGSRSPVERPLVPIEALVASGKQGVGGRQRADARGDGNVRASR